MLLHRLDQALLRVGDLPSVFFELLFEIGAGLAISTTRAFVPVKRSLRPRGRPFAPARDKVTSILGLGPNAGRHSRGLGLH